MGKSITERVKYQGVAVPVPMIEEMRRFVIKHSEYRSVSEFVRVAIREKMDSVDPRSRFSHLYEEREKNKEDQITELKKTIEAFNKLLKPLLEQLEEKEKKLKK